MIGFYNYTVILTYIGLACALEGIVSALNGWYPAAVVALMLAGVCDMFDGKIARSKKDRTDDEKRFGIQIDSLCDLICFGVFPAVIGYSLGVKSVFGSGFLFLYVLAAVIRLAYFNVTEEQRQQETNENRKYFQGLPVTSVALIIPMIFLTKPYFGAKFALVYQLTLIVLAILFLLDIKIKKVDRKMTIFLAIVALGVVLRLIVLCKFHGGL